MYWMDCMYKDPEFCCKCSKRIKFVFLYVYFVCIFSGAHQLKSVSKRAQKSQQKSPVSHTKEQREIVCLDHSIRFRRGTICVSCIFHSGLLVLVSLVILSFKPKD